MRAPGPGDQADQADALGSDQSSEPSRPRRTRGPSPEPRRSAFGRPLPRPPGSLPVAFGRPPRPVCVAATSQVEGAFSRVVVAAERCSQGRHRKPRRSAFGRPLRRPPGSLPAAFGLVVVAAVLVALVHVRELQRVVHPMHPKRRGKRRSRSRRRRSGRPGSLPSRGTHGSGRAEFPHPALRGTVFATRHGRTHGDGSGYRCSNRRIAVGGSPRCERRRSQCHHAQTTRYRKSQTRRRLPLRP